MSQSSKTSAADITLCDEHSVGREEARGTALGPVMAWGLNLVLPGSGLIIRRREWLGFSLAVVFGICGNVALAGVLIAPAAIPTWLTGLAATLSGASWLSSQLLFWRQGVLQGRRASSLSALLREARSAMGRGELKSACVSLESAAALDDENAELYALWAKLYTLEGDEKGAGRVWRRVLKLDLRGGHREEAKRALEQLGADR